MPRGHNTPNTATTHWIQREILRDMSKKNLSPLSDRHYTGDHRAWGATDRTDNLSLINEQTKYLRQYIHVTDEGWEAIQCSQWCLKRLQNQLCNSLEAYQSPHYWAWSVTKRSIKTTIIATMAKGCGNIYKALTTPTQVT